MSRRRARTGRSNEAQFRSRSRSGCSLAFPGRLTCSHSAARRGAAIASIAMIIGFNLIKFVLTEIPIASYAVDPNGTAARVDRFSAWPKTHQMRLIAAVVGVIGLGLIARGLTRLG